jgi:hypothetical protein
MIIQRPTEGQILHSSMTTYVSNPDIKQLAKSAVPILHKKQVSTGKVAMIIILLTLVSCSSFQRPLHTTVQTNCKQSNLSLLKMISSDDKIREKDGEKPSQIVPGMFGQSLSSNPERKMYKRFMQVELWRKPELEAMYPVLCSIESACRDINRLMRRVSTDNLSGYNTAVEGGKGSVNIQGEDQKKLDVIANRIMKTALCCSGKVSIVASEEDKDPCLCSAVTDNIAFTGRHVCSKI